MGSWLRGHPTCARPVANVVAVTMVHNEEDVIGWNVRHFLDEGCRVIVADNLSTDGTRAVLEAIDDERLLILEDRDPAYRQGEKMTRLARVAADMGADWIIPFDADEWWASSDGLLSALGSCETPAAVAAVVNLIPQPDDDPEEANPFRRSRWVRPRPTDRKVAFRATVDLPLAQGNHHLEGTVDETNGRLFIRHLPYRSLEQAKAKLRHGRAVLAATGLDPALGAHWTELGGMDDFAFGRWWETWTDPNGLVRLP